MSSFLREIGQCFPQPGTGTEQLGLGRSGVDPSEAAISSWVYPSTSCMTNTARYPSGSSSIALDSRSFRSGSASGDARPSQSVIQHHLPLVRRCTFLNPLSVIEMAIEPSQVESAASPRNSPSR